MPEWQQMHEVREQHSVMSQCYSPKPRHHHIFIGLLRHGQSSSRSLKRCSNVVQCCHQTVHSLNTIMCAGMLYHSHVGNRFSKPGKNTLQRLKDTVIRLNTFAGLLCCSQSGNRVTKPGNNTLQSFKHVIKGLSIIMSAGMLYCSHSSRSQATTH